MATLYLTHILKFTEAKPVRLRILTFIISQANHNTINNWPIINVTLPSLTEKGVDITTIKSDRESIRVKGFFFSLF